MRTTNAYIRKWSGGSGQLPLTLSINSQVKTPDFCYLGKDATISAWNANTYGSNLAVVGAGADVTPNLGSPFYGLPRGGVTTTYTGKGFVAANNTIYDYTTEDLVCEVVCKVPDCSVNNNQRIFYKGSGTVTYQMIVNNNAGNTEFLFQLYNTTAIYTYSAILTPNSVAHLMWFLDRSGSGICYTNGVAGTPATISTIGSLTNTGLFYFLTIDTTNKGFTTPVYYMAMWSGIGWLDTHLQPALVAARYAHLTGAYQDHLASPNWPRMNRMLVPTGDSLTGLQSEVEVINRCPYSNDFTQWSKYIANDAIDSTNGPLGPNGINRLHGLKCDNTDVGHGIYKALDSMSSGSTYCYSIILKKATTDWILFYTNNATDGSDGYWFNINTLTWGFILDTGFTTKGFIPLGNDQILLWGTGVFNNTNGHILIAPCTDNGIGTFNGGTAAPPTVVNLWMSSAQVEIGNYPSSRIDALATALTRTADINPRTNLCPYSQALASWTQTAITSVEAATVLAPDGVNYMQGIVATAVDTNHYCSIAVTLVSGSTYCFSCWAKVGNKNWIRFYIDAGATTYSGYFNLSTLTWGTSTLPLAKDYVSYGNGLYRVYAVVVADGTAGTCYAYPAHADADPDFAGDGATVNAYFWGTMCELGTLPTGYVPTPGAVAVTVSDGSLILPAGTNIGGADKGQATYEIDFLMFAKPTASRTLLKISDWGSNLDFIKMYVDTQGYMNLSSAAVWGNPGSVQIAQNFCDGQRYRAILSYKTNYLNVRVINLDTLAEVAGVADVSVTIPIRLNTIEKGPLEYGIIS